MLVAASRRPLTVYKSNDLVNARYDWTAMQHRVVLMLISQLDGEAEDFGEQEVPVADLVELGGQSSNAYGGLVAEAADALLGQTITIPSERPSRRGKRGKTTYNLFSRMRVEEGRVFARFNLDMRPLLLQLKKRYTRYVLENALRFQSPYSVRLYEMAMQFSDLGHRTILVEDLRYMLMLEDKYPRFADFRRRVLDQATSEINEKTDLVVSFDVERKGQTPHAIKLYIRWKERVEARLVPKAKVGEQAALFHPPPRPPGEREAPEHAAFRSWWKARSDKERAELEAAAKESIDADTRRVIGDDWSGTMASRTLRGALQELWMERTEAVTA